jgi:hypothetical protein
MKENLVNNSKKILKNKRINNEKRKIFKIKKKKKKLNKNFKNKELNLNMQQVKLYELFLNVIAVNQRKV